MILTIVDSLPAADVVEVRQKTGRMEWVQTFESLEAAGKAWT